MSETIHKFEVQQGIQIISKWKAGIQTLSSAKVSDRSVKDYMDYMLYVNVWNVFINTLPLTWKKGFLTHLIDSARTY